MGSCTTKTKARFAEGARLSSQREFWTANTINDRREDMAEIRPILEDPTCQIQTMCLSSISVRSGIETCLLVLFVRHLTSHSHSNMPFHILIQMRHLVMTVNHTTTQYPSNTPFRKKQL